MEDGNPPEVNSGLEGRLAVGSSWAPSSILVYSGPPLAKPFDNSISDTPQLRWPHGTGKSTRKSQCVEEISTSQEWSGVERQLASEGYGVFCELQRACEGGNITVEQLLQISRHYRAVIHICVMELQEEDNGYLEGTTDEAQNKADMFVLMEMVWHLCEIVFIASLPAGYFVGELSDWVCWHSNHADKLMALITNHRSPNSNRENYWTLVYALVLEGRFREARELLMKHSACSNNANDEFASMDELLRCIPMNKEGMSHHELCQYWQVWWREVNQRRNAGTFARTPELLLLSQLLSGDDKAFREVKERYPNSCPRWYHMMIGKLLYCYPTIISSDYELLHVAESCQAEYGADSSFDEVLTTALKGNVVELLSAVSSKVNNWWFAAHLTDLLFRAGLLQEAHYEYGSDLQEFLMLEYGSGLMEHESLWQIGAHYLITCPNQGKGYLSLFLDRIPLTCKNKALKVLRLCRKYDLIEQVQTICKVMALQDSQKGKLASALQWCLLAKDSSFATSIVDRYIDDYISAGKLRDFDWFNNMEANIMISNKMAFLCKYSEFHKFYAGGDFQAAGNLLSLLLEKRLVPIQFWLTLLTDALPLLEHPDQIVFSREQTLEMAKCIKVLEETKFNERDDRKELIHVALGRNLCRAEIKS